MQTHILFIDDDKDELPTFFEALKKIPFTEDFKFTYTTNGKEGMEILKCLTPNYIFVDLNLPEMDANKLLTAIRRNKNMDDTKVFLYSGKSDKITHSAALLLGIDGCIEKNLSFQQLVETLTGVFFPGKNGQATAFSKC